MDINGIKALLERYRNNQCTAEEKKALEEWFDAQSEAGQWEWSDLEQQSTDARIKSNIDQQLFGKKRTLWPLLRVAAILVLLLGSLFFFRNDLHDWADPVVMIEKKVEDGKQLQLTLPDGSKVWLNAGSKFSYPDRFSRGKRQVFLSEGEGYFDISHDPSSPFIVTSKGVNTKVLGTAFNIKAYHYLSNIQVAVTRGKVQVSDTANVKAMILLPNQQLSIDTKNGAMDKREVDASTTIVWQRGDFSFNNDRLLDVCAVLTKKYHLNFHFKQADIQDYRITAGFVSKDQIQDILTVLASANNLSYQQKGQSVTFEKLVK